MKPEELTQDLALFQNCTYGGVSPAGRFMEKADGYVRVTEYVTVTFEPRKPAEVMGQLVAAIDAQIVEAQQAVRKLEQRKAELLALPAPESV